MKLLRNAVLAALFILIAIVPAAAAPGISVLLDGNQMGFDQPPVVENGRTLVPLRAIFEGLGAQVNYDPGTKKITATKGSTTVLLTIGQDQAYKNGSLVLLDVPAKVLNGRTLVPLRFVSEALGANVGWDGTTKTVTIVSSGTAPRPPTSSGDMKVHFIDVGQADSILIQTPAGKNVLIDGGNNADGTMVVNYLNSQGVKQLDAVIATHPHEDHIGGLDTVIKAFPVSNVYMPDVTTTTLTYEDFINAVNASGAKKVKAEAGIPFYIDPVITANFLAPVGSNYQDLNNWSAVLHLAYGETSFLFTGDAEAISEAEMINSDRDLVATVLKVGHHGSSSSSTSQFLSFVAPKYAVISIGAGNDYGHPAQETLDRLAAAGAQIFRTDLSGAIIATSDGTKVSFDKAASPVQPHAPPASGGSSSKVIIQSVDLAGEVVTLKNTGTTTADLTGWKLVSETGNQTYFFPGGTQIVPGATLKVVSGPNAVSGASVLVWTKSNIWNNSGDPAALYDNAGKLIDRK